MVTNWHQFDWHQVDLASSFTTILSKSNCMYNTRNFTKSNSEVDEITMSSMKTVMLILGPMSAILKCSEPKISTSSLNYLDSTSYN